MKKLLIGCAVAAMMMSAGAPAKADSDWVAPAILGTIFGVIIANNGHGYIVRHHRHVRRDIRRHHRRNHRHRRPSTYWVEVCDNVPHLRQNHYGDYYTVMRYECRMVKKARW